MNYLIKFRPLEPYAFGTDQGFVYPGENRTGKESYFVRSKDMPEQTTILGLMRYLILQHKGLLKTNFDYTKEEREAMKACIGPKSFSYTSKEKQDFGSITSISPLFLVNGKEEILVKNPLHNTSKEEYVPMEMEAGVETSFGTISVPTEDSYKAKDGYIDGYFNLTTKETLCDIFESHVVTGNRKDIPEGQEKKDGFFKRELKTFGKKYADDNFAFAVFAEVDDFPEKTIGYMGKKKSAFMVEAKEVDDIDLVTMVKNAFKSESGVWEYALSDLVVAGDMNYTDFCIIQDKQQRNLETDYDEKQHLKRMKKSQVGYHLVGRGSVFYQKCGLNIDNPNCEQIGYNKIVKLGGM